MAHANTAFVLEIEAESYEDARNLVENVATESEQVTIPNSYPDDPHPDIMAEGLSVKINGNRYRWKYSGSPGSEYEGNREGLGFYLQEKTKKYGGRTTLEEAGDITEDFTQFAKVATQADSEIRNTEGYVTVVTV